MFLMFKCNFPCYCLWPSTFTSTHLTLALYIFLSIEKIEKIPSVFSMESTGGEADSVITGNIYMYMSLVYQNIKEIVYHENIL